MQPKLTFRDLPRDIHLAVVKRMGMVGRMAYRVPPGKLQVPDAVVALLKAIPRLTHMSLKDAHTTSVRLGPDRTSDEFQPHVSGPMYMLLGHVQGLESSHLVLHTPAGSLCAVYRSEDRGQYSEPYYC